MENYTLIPHLTRHTNVELVTPTCRPQDWHVLEMPPRRLFPADILRYLTLISVRRL